MSLTENEKDLKTFYPEGKKITIAGVEYAIKPFVLKNRLKAVKIIVDIMKEIGNEITPEIQKNPIQSIPILINAAGERLIDLYALVLGKDKDTLLEQEITIKDEVEIMTAVFEVNDIPFIVRRIQESMPKAAISK